MATGRRFGPSGPEICPRARAGRAFAPGMRTVLSLVVLAVVLWASCTVKLGAFTLAEHVDRIGQTDEAKALLTGARGKIAPALEDMKQRVFGEYVEAPTTDKRRPQAPERPAKSRAEKPPERAPERPERARTVALEKSPPAERPAAVGAAEPASRPSTAEASRLPGARRKPG